jgi:hypothetical protein
VAAFACYIAGAFFGPGIPGALVRLTLALALPVALWTLVFDAADRSEIRTALGR